ncbi:DNA helicase [Trifolium repens]|nr:DNA helicase [Trifolium repens]
MNASEVQLTQGVSQVYAPITISLEDDLLTTKRMTTEDLIESDEENSWQKENKKGFKVDIKQQHRIRNH